MKRLFAVAGRARWLFVAAIAGTVAGAVLRVVAADMIGGLVTACTLRQRGALERYTLLGPAVVIAIGAAVLIERAAGGAFAHLALARLRRAIAERLARAAPAAHVLRHSGDVLSSLSGDAPQIGQLVEADLPAVVGRVIAAILAAGYMLGHHAWLTLAAVAPTPLLVWLASRVGAPLVAMGEGTQAELAQANIVAKEALDGAELVRAAGMQPRLLAGQRAASDRWVAAKLGQGERLARLTAVGLLMSIAPNLLVFGVGGALAVRGEIDLGLVFAFVGLVGTLTFPLQELPQLVGQIRVKRGALARVLALLEMPIEPSAGADEIDRASDVLIELRDVEVCHDGVEQPVLRGVDLIVRRGERVAIVGASGAGKSTLLRLILGDLEASRGEVLLGGQSAERLARRARRELFAVVDQDAFMFDLTMRENLCLDRVYADEDTRRAAAAAAIDDEIAALPHGYDTPIGERGSRLSGGQRQRVALARALLRGAPVLLLDEATASLDNALERRVIANLLATPPQGAIVVVAHRLGAIRKADRIYVLDNGTVVASGTHEDLIARPGRYAELYRGESERAGAAHA